MKLSCLIAIALLSFVAVQARDYTVPATPKRSKTYYSYSYKPTGGSSVHASGFTHGGGFHWNHSTSSSSSTTSSSLSTWKSKANSAASKLSSSVKLPTLN